MAVKTYDARLALDPGQTSTEAQQPAADPEEIDYSKFVSELPKEFQAEIEEALSGLLSYIHSDEGTTQILQDVQAAKGNEASQIGISALQAMDAADPDHKWSDSAKTFCGYFAVKEVAGLAREAGIVDIPEQQEGEIFKQAAQNYIHAIIKNKPTQAEREAEAIRIQKEVEPLMSEKMRAAGHSVAQDKGIPVDPDMAKRMQEKYAKDIPGKQQQPPTANQGGLLE